MKKCFFILMVALIAIGALFVSCKNEVQAPAEELVSVSFDKDSSRSLSSNLEGFDKDVYYWKYAAKKADASNLISGQTANYDTDPEDGAQWIKEGQQGLGSYNPLYVPFKVQGFSQGLWNFRLFAYKDAAGTQLVYSGETTGVLLRANSDDHRVNVIVSPAQEGNGTLEVKITGEDKITLDPVTPGLIPNASIWLKVEKIGVTTPIYNNYVTEDYVNDGLEAGTYKVTVEFTNGETAAANKVVYASGSVVSTVYSNLKTTIKGNLTEVVTYADFGADQNPDIITTTIGTTNPIVENTGSPTDSIVLSGTSTKVTASLSNETAQSLITDLKEELAADSETSSMTLNLSVDTTEATETTITYEIGMEAVLAYTKNNVQTQTTSTVKEVDDFVTIKIELQRGLSDIKVMHDTTYMTECESLADLMDKTTTSTGAEAGFFFYQDPYNDPNDNPDLGPDETKAMLYIRTYKFSPFKLSYTVSKVVATIGGQEFETLQSAIAASTGDDVIVMASNVTLTEDVQVGAKELTINLNGYTVTGSNHILPNTDNYFTVQETYGDYYDYEYDPGYIRIRHKEASIGSVLYNRLPQAFKAVTDSNPTTIVVEHDSVVVVKNTAATNPKFTGNAGITIPAGKDITLDLNGYTVKNAVNENKASQVFAVENSTLTIMDSSSSGTGLLTNAVMEGTEPGEWWGTPQYNYATNVIKNSGTVNVVSGKIIQTASGSICYAVDNNSTSYNAVLNISGGYLGGIKTVIRQFCNSTTRENTINMTSGVVEGVRRGIWTQLPGQNPASMKKATVNISGGTIRISSESTDYAFCDDTDGDGWDNVNYSLSGGYFDGAIASDKIGYKFITGGSYSNDPSAYVVDGYTVEKDGERWIVVPPPAIQIRRGEELFDYSTLQDALNAVQDDDLILINVDLDLNPEASEISTVTAAKQTYHTYLKLTRNVKATMNLQGHNITCTIPELSPIDAVSFLVLSGDNSSDDSKVFSIENGIITLNYPDHVNSSTGYTQTNITDVAILLVDHALASIKNNFTLETNSTGIKLLNNSRITELNAVIHSKKTSVDKNGGGDALVNAYDSICVGQYMNRPHNARIDVISGGEYSSLFPIDNEFVKSQTGYYALSMWEGASIGKISGGSFSGDYVTTAVNGSACTALRLASGASIGTISGGEFFYNGNFTQNSYSRIPAAPLYLYSKDYIGLITGGFFYEGYSHDNAGTQSYTVDRNNKFVSIVEDSNCELIEVGSYTIKEMHGDTVVSSKTLPIYEVRPIN